MPERLTTSLSSLGAKLFLCAGPGQLSNLSQTARCSLYHLLVDPCSPPRYDKPYRPRIREICCYTTSQPSTWGNQRGSRSHQANFGRSCRGSKQNYTLQLSRHQEISGAIAGDSNLQERGVAHYLLSLL